jgi:hypothetical protein
MNIFLNDTILSSQNNCEIISCIETPIHAYRLLGFDYALLAHSHSGRFVLHGHSNSGQLLTRKLHTAFLRHHIFLLISKVKAFRT